MSVKSLVMTRKSTCTRDTPIHNTQLSSSTGRTGLDVLALVQTLAYHYTKKVINKEMHVTGTAYNMTVPGMLYLKDGFYKKWPRLTGLILLGQCSN